MEHIRLQLIPIAEMNKDLYCQDGMHSDYFREFVQMMLCHAWSIGFLHSDLWDAIPDIAQAATMHDIGKTALPETIINKKGALSSAEREFVKAHTILGAAMVEIALAEMKDDPIYEYALEICRHHHERVNGRGYPDRLWVEKSSPMFRLSAWPTPTMHFAVPEATGMPSRMLRQ